MINNNLDKNMITEQKSKKFFISFLLGGAVGGAIALLYAPKSGKHLRNDISRGTEKIIKDGKRFTSRSWNDVKDFAGNTYEKAGNLVNAGMDTISEQTENVKDAINSGISAFRDERKNEKIHAKSRKSESRETHN
jgi:gas vesicle protein